MLALPLIAVALVLPASPEPVMVQPDPVAAERAAIVGATDGEREAARAALAGVPDLPVRALEFYDLGPRRALRIDAPGVEAGVRTGWLARFFTAVLARPLEATETPVRWVGFGERGQGSAVWSHPGPDRSPDELAAFARAAAARVSLAGWSVTELRAWAADAGAVALTIRLTEEQFLSGRTDWLTTAFAPFSAGAPTTLLTVEGPDGTELPWGGSHDPTPGAAPPPAGLAGPTRLEIEHRRFTVAGRAARHRVVLDCSGGASTNVPDVAATCARVVGDRYRLLAPVPADAGCSSTPFADTMAIRGHVFGMPVERAYDGCYGATTLRWTDVVRVPARPRALPRALDREVRASVVGGTRRERRAARASLAGVAFDLPRATVTFGRRDGRRTTRVDAGELPDGSDLSRADAAWLAERVRQDIVARLLGTPAEPPRTAALERRLSTLTARATAAGWHVRLARAWPLRHGPYLTTIRLTERQLLDGRIDWEHVVGGPRPRRDAVRVAVEAPDGTLVAGGGMPFPRGDAPPPPGIQGPTRLTIAFTFGLGGSRHYVLDCDGDRSEGIPDVAAACARLVADRYALLAPERDRCVASGGGQSVHLTGTFRGVAIRRYQTGCVRQVVQRWRTFLGATSPAVDPPTTP